MQITPIASGSSGNCYTISDGETTLMIECGIPIKDIMLKTGYKFNDVTACLISHAHQDHALAHNDLLNSGIDLYLHKDTAESLNVKGYGVNIAEAKKQFIIGTFAVLPFDCVHCNSDGSECMCLGYLLYSVVTQEKLMFATDTAYIHNKFKDLNYVMIEVNYMEDYIQDEAVTEVEKRRYKSHMSLETALAFLNAHDLSQVKQIYAIHLSKKRSLRGEVRRQLIRATGKEIIIC